MGRAPALNARCRTGARAGLVGLTALALSACFGPPRSQLLVVITTDLATPSDVAADQTISGAAALDRVRAEVLAEDGTVLASNTFIVATPASLPLAFGVEVDADTPTLLRVTGFHTRLTLTRSGDVAPPPLATVSRLLRTSARKSEVTRVEIALRGDCLALAPDLVSHATCAHALREDAGQGDDSDAHLATATWARAREVPCASSAPRGTLCIPGGISELGAPDLAEVDVGAALLPAPPRLAALAPFFMDQDEMTVGAFRVAYRDHHLTTPKPTLAAVDTRCNYSDGTGNETAAVRCVPFETARAVCRALGGDLPSLTQWEHAARGRGRGLRYPWGDAPPECCTAALASLAAGYSCNPNMVAVGAYAAQKGCALHDVSLDGVHDLGGSVREWVKDAAVSVAECGGPGLLSDAACAPPGAALGSTKGGSFRTPLEGASSALRSPAGDLVDVGFRCVR